MAPARRLLLRGWATGTAAVALVALAACGSGGEGPATAATSHTDASARVPGPVLTTSPSPAPCRTTGLGLELIPVIVSDSQDTQQTIFLRFRNTSDSPCTLTGVPDVELKQPDGDIWDLVHSTQVPSTTITLAPDAQAHARLTYLSVDPADKTSVAFRPAVLAVTTPGNTKQLVAKWPGGAVLRQDGATHPGTYISAFTAED